MQISYVCEPGAVGPDGGANEDVVAAAGRFVVVLDGATTSGLPTGCVHDVRWLAGRLAWALAGVLTERPGLDLREVLREGIVRTRGLHPGCDLANPESPSATVALVREHDGRLDCLTLADSPVVVETHDGALTTVVDDRLDRLPPMDRETAGRLRNTDAGFWVAGTRPEAADRAVTVSFRTAEVRSFALLSDGVSRLVERFGWSWEQLLRTLEKQGPAHLVRSVREAELAMAEGSFRGKRHDDATVVFGLPVAG
ncbi:protein phosphatase 2C domain-containing protein [Kitasatospora sp. MBT63]|uniref:protein phosphatase 2C domain-containing protein n=1 Tax=Kitasatospora sp. MBT63 TaxID=1444768 RepID=UPI00053A5558|nr:protein phosphatase 2C domain-containing protein [Kitasatospora sp. MBT63]